MKRFISALLAGVLLSTSAFPAGWYPGGPFTSFNTLPWFYNQPAPTGVRPANSVLPVISGTPQVGLTLTASNGTWTNSPTGFADQWLANGSAISGATGSTYVPVTGNIGATITVAVTASNANGSSAATSASVGPVTSSGGSVPAFVATVCPGLPSTGICVDLVGNQAWDGVAGGTVSPASLLTDTRAAAVPYDPGTSITTSVAANTLPIGSAGLQVFQNNVNLELASGGNYTSTAPSAAWITSVATVATPTRTLNPNFGGSGCTAADTAPDGSCNTTEIVIPPLTSAAEQSSVEQLVTGLTAGQTYTFYMWLKNSAAVANPQTYLFAQQGLTPFTELSRSLTQPGATWQRFSTTFTVPSGQTSVYVGVGNATQTVASFQEGQLGGGTFEAWVSQVNLGAVPSAYVPTTTAAATTVALDNITATGDLATALATSNGAIAITTHGAGNAVAATMLDSNGTVLLGKSAADHITTALGATLASKAAGNFSAVEQSYLAWNGSGGSINVNGTLVATDATARTPTAPFHVGTTSGTSAPFNGYINSIAVYGSAISPPLVASTPITGVTFGTIATLSSGTLQGAAPSTFVNGDTWMPTEDAAGNNWAFCNDCAYGAFGATTDGNIILTESSWTPGTPGYLNLGNATGGPPGLVSNFSPGPLGRENTDVPSTTHSWKSCGLIAVSDGANTDLFGGITLQNQTTAAPWNFNTIQASVISVTTANAATSSLWNGMPPYSGSLQPVASPTFPTQQFSNPCFIQYAPGYVNSTLPTPNPDNSGTYLYAVSNDGGWNTGGNVYLGRIPLATIETSQGGSLAAASTASNWQFYVSTGCSGGDGMNNSCWTSTLTSATPIFTLPNQLGRSAMTYLPGSNRYVLQSWYYPTNNGPAASTQTEARLAFTSQWEFIDCAKPWSCTSVVSTIDWGTLGYYNPVIVPPSLALDGGLTATSIFAGNFTTNQTFTSAASYTPVMGQMTFKY